jgi:spore maturation protein CgeB
MSLKLLIVGSKSINSLENIYIKYLKLKEIDIYHIDLTDFYSYSGIINKILYIISYRTLYNKANQELLNYVEKCNPNFIWVFKGVELKNTTLLTLREKKIKLIYYNPDHPFIRNSVSHGKNNVEKNISLYDIHFSYQSDLTTFINSKYNLPSYNLPFGYDLTNDEYSSINEKEIKRVCFVGTPDKERVKLVNYLIKNKIPLDLYGNEWSRVIKFMPNVNVLPSVVNLEFYKTLFKYRIQLNLFRKHNFGSHNMRFFEIPAVGGVQLSNFSCEASDFFEEGKEIFFFKTKSDLIKKIHTILNYDEGIINEIRIAARNRSLTSKYSYQNRTNYFYNIITNI